jgi:hypothetical protein
MILLLVIKLWHHRFSLVRWCHVRQVQFHLNATKPTLRTDEGGTIARKARRRSWRPYEIAKTI